MSVMDQVASRRLDADLVGVIAVLEKAGRIQLECSFDPNITESRKKEIATKLEVFAKERFCGVGLAG